MVFKDIAPSVPPRSMVSQILFSAYTVETVGAKFMKPTIAAYAVDIAIYSSFLSATRALRQVEANEEITKGLEGLNKVNPKKSDYHFLHPKE